MQKLTEFIKNNYIIIAVVLLAAVLRFVGLDYAPPSLNWDEISHGYNAYSILRTGKDEWGETMPIIFRAYGDYKLPVYIYLTALSEALFGLTPFAVRFFSALGGVLTVVFTYLLTVELGKLTKSDKPLSKLIGLLAAFLVAISPWTLVLSRGAFEANLALTFIVIGAYFFLRGLHTRYSILLSVIFFGLSVWTYNSARVFVPLFLVSIALIFRRELIEVLHGKRILATSCILTASLFFLPMVYQMANPVGSARYDKVAILDEGAINKINEARNTSEYSPLISKALNNKVTYFGREFTKNYVSHFSPNYLFISGGDQYQFSVPKYGLMFSVNAIFFLLGFFILLKWRNKRTLFIMLWLFLAPIASSVTRESPHVLRNIVMLPIPMLITGVGLVWFVEKYKRYKKILLVSYVIAMVLFLESFLTTYFNDYREKYSWSFQYGYEELVDYLNAQPDYKLRIITKKYGEPHEFVLFYNAWDPDSYRNDNQLNRFEQSEWYWVDGFDRYYFINDWEVTDGPTDQEFMTESDVEIDCTVGHNDCILVTSPGNVPDSGWKLVHTINFLDGVKAFEIYENTYEIN